jgi:hypothetical protein
VTIVGTGFLIGVSGFLLSFFSCYSLVRNDIVYDTNETCEFCFLGSGIRSGVDVGQMFKPVRVVATIVFLASIGLVFVGAFVIRSEVSGWLCFL